MSSCCVIPRDVFSMVEPSEVLHHFNNAVAELIEKWAKGLHADEIWRAVLAKTACEQTRDAE